MTNEREERIRRRAHELWEKEGRPDGRHEDHWQQAMRDLDMDADEALQSESMKGVSADPVQDRPSKGRKRRTEPGVTTSDLLAEATEPKRRATRRTASAPGPAPTTADAPKRRSAAKAAEGPTPSKARRAPRKRKEESAPAAADGPEQA
jgi:hypothetical protein